jgi:hypothetical protein
MSTHNFHSLREEKDKVGKHGTHLPLVNISWDHFYKKMEKKGVVNLQLPCNYPQKVEAYLKGAHCIFMLTLQICSTSIGRSLSRSLQDFFKLKKMP